MKTGTLKDIENAKKKAEYYLKFIFSEINIKKDIELKTISKPCYDDTKYGDFSDYKWHFFYKRQYEKYKFKNYDCAFVDMNWNGDLIEIGYSRCLNPGIVNIKINKKQAQKNAIEIVNKNYFTFLNKLFSGGILSSYIINKNNPIKKCDLYWVAPNDFLKKYSYREDIDIELLSYDVRLAYIITINLKNKDSSETNSNNKIEVWIDAENGKLVGGKGYIYIWYFPIK